MIGNLIQSLQEIKSDMRSKNLITGSSTGLIICLMVIVLSVSFASMIFSGPLVIHVDKGIGVLLTGSLIFVLVTTLLSGIRSIVAMPQDSPVAIYAGVAATIVSAMGNTGSMETFITIIGGMILVSVGTGLFFYLVGRFKLADLFRFMPFPVISGFLAGTGWLLAKGSLDVMTGLHLTLDLIPAMFAPNLLILWLPGMIFALLLFFLMHRFSNFLILPGSVVLAIALYYLALWGTGTSLEEARQAGMFFQAFTEGAIWPAFSVAELGRIDWPVLLRHLPALAIIPFISLLGMLLNTGGIELAARTEFDMSRELKANGIAGILSGLVGSTPGYNTLSLSALGLRAGANTRVVGLTIVVILGLTILFGSNLLLLFPKAVLGGFLMLLGIFFIYDWLIDTAKKMPRVDHLLVISIFLIICLFGYLHGVIFGLLATMLFFVIRFSRVPLLRSVESIARQRSMRQRPLPQQKLLALHGERAAIYNLEGYIFFATVSDLVNRITETITSSEKTPVELLILNFKQVSGYDISSINTFIRLINRFTSSDVNIVFVATPPGFHSLLQQNLDSERARKLQQFPDMDSALQWAEEFILEREHALLKTDSQDGSLARARLFDETSDDIMLALDRQVLVEALIEKLEAYLEDKECPRGTVLLRVGDKAPGIYLVKSGVITESVDTDKDTTTVVRNLGPGTFFAEESAYSPTVSTYTYRAKTGASVSILTPAALRKADEELPATSLQLHRLVIEQLLTTPFQ